MNYGAVEENLIFNSTFLLIILPKRKNKEVFTETIFNYNFQKKFL